MRQKSDYDNLGLNIKLVKKTVNKGIRDLMNVNQIINVNPMNPNPNNLPKFVKRPETQ